MYVVKKLRSIVAFIVFGALSFSVAAQSTNFSIENYNSVTDERLINPEDHNWLSYRGTLDGWGYSSLEIGRAHV